MKSNTGIATVGSAGMGRVSNFTQLPQAPAREEPKWTVTTRVLDSFVDVRRYFETLIKKPDHNKDCVKIMLKFSENEMEGLRGLYDEMFSLKDTSLAQEITFDDWLRNIILQPELQWVQSEFFGITGNNIQAVIDKHRTVRWT